MITVITPPTQTRLISVDYATRRLNLSAKDLAEVGDLIDDVTGYLEDETNRRLALQVVTETFPITYRSELVLSVVPVSAILEVRIDGEILETDQYFLQESESGKLYRRRGWAEPSSGLNVTKDTGLEVFQPGITKDAYAESGKKIIEVDYRGGYFLPTMSGSPAAGDVRLPAALVALALDLVRYRIDRGSVGGTIKKEELPGYKVEYREPRPDEIRRGVTLELASRIDRFERIGLA